MAKTTDIQPLPRDQPDRPFVLDEQRQKQIVESVAAGNYLTTACRAAGTTDACYHHWKKRWQEGDPTAQRFADFFESVEKALAISEESGLNVVRAGEQGWQANAWFLERRFPKRWGKKETVKHEGLPQDMSNLSDEQLEAIARGKGRR